MIKDVFVIVRWSVDFLKDAASNSKYHEKIRKMRSTGEWERRRLEIWSRYAMPSLLRQTWSEFRALMLCDPSRYDMIDRLRPLLPDDRFEIVTDWKSRRIRIAAAGAPDHRVMFCRMDSDDMYHPGLITAFVSSIPRMDAYRRSCVQAKEGYCLNADTGRIYRWKNPSPPFFCMIKRREELEKDLPGGSGIAHHGRLGTRAIRIDKLPLFCVTLNGGNICNRMTVPWRKEEIKGSELEQVRKDYGIENARP